MSDRNHTDEPATLVAIAIAAKRSGDRTLVRTAIDKLRDQFDIRISFGSKFRPRLEGAAR